MADDMALVWRARMQAREDTVARYGSTRHPGAIPVAVREEAQAYFEARWTEVLTLLRKVAA